MDDYYYAGGTRIALERDRQHVAVDSGSAPEALAKAALADATAAKHGPEGVVVARQADITPAHLAELRHAGALRPVFRRGGALLVPTPEVRVEMDGPAERAAVKAFLANSKRAVDVVEESDDRLTLRPVSGDAADALDTANAIYENAHPAMSSVRFLQFVDKR